jgi:uncharacterized damage-inducible protein DinB
MFRKVDDFLKSYDFESKSTQKMLDSLTDASLQQRVASDHRTLGNAAWHIVATVPEMMGHTGLTVAGPAQTAPTPASAKEIADAYRTVSTSLAEQVKAEWTDESLEVVDDLYGEKWARGMTLVALINHEIHHRGQLTVLMRQAGLRVPGIYGPAKEDWAVMGMEAPPE